MIICTNTFMIVKCNAKFVNERSIALLELRSCYCMPVRSNDNAFSLEWIMNIPSRFMNSKRWNWITLSTPNGSKAFGKEHRNMLNTWRTHQLVAQVDWYLERPRAKKQLTPDLSCLKGGWRCPIKNNSLPIVRDLHPLNNLSQADNDLFWVTF